MRTRVEAEVSTKRDGEVWEYAPRTPDRGQRSGLQGQQNHIEWFAGQ